MKGYTSIFVENMYQIIYKTAEITYLNEKLFICVILYFIFYKKEIFSKN